MHDRTRHTGKHGEDLALAHLRRKGYKVLARNYRTRRGEIDIVARHQGAIVFVEVKSRRSQDFGHPKYAVTAAKQRKISLAALEYLKKHQAMEQRSRFDVVTVEHMADTTRIEVVANAFELAYP